MSALELGILDLCKRSETKSAGESLNDTLALAQLADDLGYRRFWVAEHHTDDSAEACPEILVALIAARTRRLLVGSGGVLLRYYSPLKVAETFLTIEALFPGRIELGVAKGPGVVSPQVADALVSGNRWELEADAFGRKVFELDAFLRQAKDRGDPKSPSPRARPYGVTPPPLWVLGSGTGSAVLADQVDSAYGFTLFFGDAERFGPGVVDGYRRSMAERQRPSATAIAVSMVCLEDQRRARQREDEMQASGRLKSNIVGNPAQCAARLREIAHAFGTERVLVASWLTDASERREMFSLLAEELSMSAAA